MDDEQKYQKEYYLKNKENIKERKKKSSKEYYQKNAEKFRNQAGRYRKKQFRSLSTV